MKITLVGMGSGAPGSLTAAGLETLRGVELIIGARRLLENLPEGCTANRAALYKTDEICALLRQTDCAETAVVFSGDTGFYSGAAALCRALDDAGLPYTVLPGVSSVQLLAAALGHPWQGWRLVSAHGCACDPVAACRAGGTTFFLTGGLPDIITCCRFSLHDAAPLKDSLMDLATTNEAGAVYNTYLNSFRNEDGSVNWLPVCADTHGFVVNRGLFEEYGIPLPTDYASFAAACKAFDEAGIRGFTADYLYDYTCMETLQGLSAAELTTTEGRKWRTAYSDPADTARVGLDNTVWPGAFARMEQFIRDTGLTAADLELNYDDVTGMFGKGELAMYFSSSAGVQMFREQGIDATFLPFFSQNGEKWLMTTPYFQVALNRGLEQDAARRVKAMQVLHVMLSEGAQEQILADGQDLLSYSQNVSYHLTHTMEDVRSVVEENHMYIRIASNDFFSISKNVVSRMIAGEYTAEQAYQAFNAQLLADEPAPDAAVLTSDKDYSNVFHADSGNAAFSVMANTLRGVYDTDVLIAAANSFTGSVLAADYTENMAASMIMPNALFAYQRTMNGAELIETVRAFVEGCEGGFTPFNRGSLPVVSGIAIEVKEENGGFTLTGIKRDGKPLREDESVTVTCLATAGGMAPLLADESRAFEGGDTTVRDTWSAYVSGGNAVLAEPENYITLR